MTTATSGARDVLATLVLGAVGGAINAWLCFARFPVAVEDNPAFAWAIVPGGALHGGLLAMLPVMVGLRERLAQERRLAMARGGGLGGRRQPRRRFLGLAAATGSLGSLWFWIEYGPWYFAIIHGTIWGVLVGCGASRLAASTERGVA